MRKSKLNDSNITCSHSFVECRPPMIMTILIIIGHDMKGGHLRVNPWEGERIPRRKED
jgi:hypothetical protein